MMAAVFAEKAETAVFCIIGIFSTQLRRRAKCQAETNCDTSAIGNGNLPFFVVVLKYALICWVDVHCIHSYNDGDAIFSERIIFLIQKN